MLHINDLNSPHTTNQPSGEKLLDNVQVRPVEQVALTTIHVSNEKSPMRAMLSLRKMAAKKLVHEKAFAMFVNRERENRPLTMDETFILNRQKREFQKGLQSAWLHFEDWSDLLRMHPAAIDLTEHCLRVDPFQIALLQQIIEEFCPALLYYFSEDDLVEFDRFLCSMLLARKITKEEFSNLKGIGLRLPSDEDKTFEPAAKRSSQGERGSLERAVGESVLLFIQDCLIQGSVCLRFKDSSVEGASYAERQESLDQFLSQLKEHLTVLLQGNNKEFYVKIQGDYPFDPQAVHNSISHKVKEKMKLPHSLVEAAAAEWSQPVEEVSVFPLKMAWLILSCVQLPQFKTIVDNFRIYLESFFAKKSDKIMIDVKNVEMSLKGDLSGLMAKIESSIILESKKSTSVCPLVSGYKSDAFLIESGSLIHGREEKSVTLAAHTIFFPFNFQLLNNLYRFAEAHAESEIALSLERLVQFLKQLSWFGEKQESSFEPGIKKIVSIAGEQEEPLNSSTLSLEADFLAAAARILKEGVAAVEKSRRVSSRLKGGFYSLRKHSKDVEYSFEGSVSGLLALKENRAKSGWKCTPESWFSLIDLLDCNLRNKLPLKEPHMVLSVPKNSRSYSELAWDAIYQSEKPEDIDWKCKRYQELLRQLKMKCQVHCLEGDSGLFETNTLSIKAETVTRQQLDILRAGFTETFLQSLRAKLTDDVIFGAGEKSPYMKVAETLMTEINLDDPALSMLDKFVSWGASLIGDESNKLPKGNDVSMVDGFEVIWKCLNAVPVGAKRPPTHQIASSARGRWNVDFDPIRQGNLPQMLGKIHFYAGGAETIVKALAFGSPTMEGTFSYAVLTPEFKACMALYQSLGKSHLFVLNQNQIPSWRILGEVETDRIEAINTFAEQKVPDALYVAVLSKNSPFYFQSGEFAEMSSITLFKDAFIKQHFDLSKSVTGNSFSANLFKKIPDLRQRVIDMVEVVHQFLFCGEVSLSREDRLLFIDVTQSLLTLLLIRELGVVSFNISCKDAIDRAIVSYALLLALVALLSQKNQDRAFRRNFFMVVFARALMVRKRPIFFERLERITHGVRGFEKHAEKLAKAAEVLFKDCSVFYTATT